MAKAAKKKAPKKDIKVKTSLSADQLLKLAFNTPLSIKKKTKPQLEYSDLHLVF